MDLNLTWFILLGVLLIGYAILDGFDLGVGILHLVNRTDRERRTAIGAIGPVWDGNEVWLVTFGGALFAAFPEAYATLFSAFYTGVMALLFCLIFRAVSLEFRGQIESPAWRRTWDVGFFLSSLIATFLFGLMVGTAIVGIPLDERGDFIGSFGDLCRPYALLVGAMAVAMMAMHGAIYLYLKTEGALQQRWSRWMWHTWGSFLALYLLTTVVTLLHVEQAVENVKQLWWPPIVVVINVLAIANIPRAIFQQSYKQAFLSSSITIACLVCLLSLALYPNLVTASNDPALSLTIERAASSQKTLQLMLVFAIIGMPLVLMYTGIVYWTFRGKVKVDDYH